MLISGLSKVDFRVLIDGVHSILKVDIHRYAIPFNLIWQMEQIVHFGGNAVRVEGVKVRRVVFNQK